MQGITFQPVYQMADMMDKVQVTALAPTGIGAEALSKAALLSGAEEATAWLPHGGLVVYDDSSIDVVAPDSTEVER